MSATERLYYNDSRLLEFDARVIGVSQRDDGAVAITLDRTAFYPTGGGQPSDTGTLGEARVIDCIDVEDEGVLHVIQGPVPDVDDTVHGKVDWLRRLDHMHILSAAFVRLFAAPTHSFRVLEDECEIDLALDDPTDERVDQAFDLANQIIWECRPIQIRQVTTQEAASLPLRKEPARAGELRLIEIDEFDLTPCGGTHAKSTGEVGVIAVRSWERAKGLTRIQFMAGIRVLSDYRRANRTARAVAELLSAGREDSPALLKKLIEENKKLTRRVRDLDEVACRVEAEQILRESRLETGYRPPDPTIIAKVFDDRHADSLKLLALALMTHPNVVALLGSRDGETARLVFARSPDGPGDMNALMKEACVMLDGRGGGKIDLAQGGGRKIEKLEEAIDSAYREFSGIIAP